jgi:hypothetical protein
MFSRRPISSHNRGRCPPPAEGAGATITYGTDSGLTSDADRMISYRHQERTWQTTDGKLHTIINRGSLNGAGLSLCMYTSVDNGQSWTLQFTIANSNELSTGSGDLTAANVLWFCYLSNANSIIQKVYTWDTGSSTWSTTATETIFSNVLYTVSNPALGIDVLGAVWCAFPAELISTGVTSIRMIRRAGGGVWSDTGTTFGAATTTDNIRSARPMRVPGGMGILFTVGEHFYWGVRVNADPVGTWTVGGTPIYSKPATDPDPYASHWSIARDAALNIHVALSAGGRLVYLRWRIGGLGWDGQGLTAPASVTYPQAAVMADGTIALSCNDSNAYVRIYRSADAGATFRWSDTLRHPAVTATQSYPYPRIEGPSNCLAWPLPLLLQYETTGSPTQHLMRFF